MVPPTCFSRSSFFIYSPIVIVLSLLFQTSLVMADSSTKLPNAQKPDHYRLTILSDPPEAHVEVQGLKNGYVPGIALKSGRYHIRISHPGYETEKGYIDIDAQEWFGKVVLRRQTPADEDGYNERLRYINAAKWALSEERTALERLREELQQERQAISREWLEIQENRRQIVAAWSRIDTANSEPGTKINGKHALSANATKEKNNPQKSENHSSSTFAPAIPISNPEATTLEESQATTAPQEPKPEQVRELLSMAINYMKRYRHSGTPHPPKDDWS